MNEKDQQVVKDIKSSGVWKVLSSFFCWIYNLICKINRKTLIDIVIIAIPIILIYMWFVGVSPKDIKETRKDNKRIEAKVDSVKESNEFITKRMYELEKNQILFFDLINKNNSLIQENNKELTQLKKIYNAKINSANNYSVSQLDSFFTNRYKEYYR